ncbi:MAG: PD40 domain-containing protein [Acidobacteria bacterium]|nr:PD40 domain-containing protein [Acidobacteriota bacterium]
MLKKKLFLILLVSLLLPLYATAENETLMLRYPDIYKDTVAFSYAGDIWTANVDGTNIKRLTSHPGVEYFPKFSPDGKWIAFTGQYDGYWQVYLIPVDGGEPKQLTYYPTTELPDRFGYDKHVMDWTPDGKYIIFRGFKGFWDAFVGRLYKISINGGFPEPMPFAEGGSMSFSPDGKKIALNRVYRDFRTWKRYKGGMAQNIWIYDYNVDKIEKITDWIGTEHHPIWHGDNIYFVADKTGKSNLYKYNTTSKEITQVTDYKDWDIKWPGHGPDAIIFEMGGKLYKMAYSDEKIAPLTFNIKYDRASLRPYYMKLASRVDSSSLAPGAKRVALTARGELFTVPAEKGNTRNLSESTGARERDVNWSPDGKWIAYISDKTGKEELYITDAMGESTTQLTSGGDQILRNPSWSPDGNKIAFWGEMHDFYYIDVKTKKITKVDTAEVGRIRDYMWSPDSKWLTYSKQHDQVFSSIYLYNLEDAIIHQVTSRATNETEPVFDIDGKYLFFISSRDFSPQFSNFESNFHYDNLDRVYVATLSDGSDSLFKPESDEVVLKNEKKDDKKDADKKEIKDIKIDIKNLGMRVAALPVTPSQVFGLSAIPGILYYIKAENNARNLYAFDLEKKKETLILEGIRNYGLSPDGKNILWQKGTTMGIAPAKTDKINTGEGLVDISGLETLVDPITEWKQIFTEAWRLPKATYYISNLHGVDWDGIFKRYSTLVGQLSHRRDLTYLIGETIGELCTSHSYTGGGDLPELQTADVGLLGAEFEVGENGYYKIVKIYKGENWNDAARSPLVEVGVKAKAGDYILEINGKKLKYPENPYRLLQKTLKTIVVLKLNDKPEEKGAWTVSVKPIADEGEIAYLTWVQENYDYVQKKTNGRIGYVHVPDMGGHGLNQFVKTWYAQIDKEGIIVDDRYNGGGFVSQMILERLRRIVVGMRYNRLFGGGTYPNAAFAGHLVMLTNLYAASDGDNFPNFFQQYKLGPVIGTRTWGGVVGYYQVHPLMDGGYEIVPQTGSYNLKGEWWMENTGVTPDIIIDTDPVDQVKNRDPQMDKAIEIIMKKIQEEPVKLPPKPADPIKIK